MQFGFGNCASSPASRASGRCDRPWWTPTLRKRTRACRGEFTIRRPANPAAFAAANLSFDTKFDLRRCVELPFTSEWFSVPPAAPHGQVPRLGTLHPSLVRAVQAAYRAVRD